MTSSSRPLTLGYSPCPNDTFIFAGLVHKKIDTRGLSFREPVLEDVETLNEWAMAGKLDVTKLSFHAYGYVSDTYVLLDAGSALGRGCGPLLVGRHSGLGDPSALHVAIPGKFTTAAMLFKMYAPACGHLSAMRFDRIMPAIVDGTVDAGVIIHESRFTYEAHGLHCHVDLGNWWEQLTGMPIPLGGIAAKRALGPTVLSAIEESIRASVRWAVQNPDRCMPYITKHAQELSPEVIAAHISLYVNAFTETLGQPGKEAIVDFLHRGMETGALPHNIPLLRYFL